MATLKSLVDETSNIKNELIECHTNLKNNLIAKGVECSKDDKLFSLINKTAELSKNHFPPWHDNGDFFISLKTTFPTDDYANQRFFTTCTSIGEDVYVTSNYKLYKLDTKTALFEFKTNLPYRRINCTSCSSGNYVYISGGRAAYNNPIREIWRYDPILGVIEKKASLIFSANRNGCTSDFVDDFMYVFGGINSNNSLVSTVECYDSILDTVTNKKASYPTSLSKQPYSSGALGSKIYFISSGLGVYDTILDAFTSKTLPFSQGKYYTCDIIGNVLYSFSTTNSIKYDILNETFTKLDDNLYCGDGYPMVCSSVGDKVYIFGYTDSNTNVLYGSVYII